MNNTKPKSPTYPNPFQRPNFETVCPWPKATKSLKVLYRTHGNFIFIISTFLKSHIFEEVKRFNHPLEYRRRHTGNLRWHSHSSCHVLWEKVDVKVANPSCSIYTFFFQYRNPISIKNFLLGRIKILISKYFPKI